MIGYIDSSALLRFLLDEEGSISEFRELQLGVSSVLLKIECLRTLERLRFENHFTEDEYLEARATFHAAFRKITFIKINSYVVDSACESWGVPLKSLDAIHLASALEWKQSQGKKLIFFTHDKRLGALAKSRGMDVLGA